MVYTNRDVALKIFTKSKGKWEVRSFGAPDKQEEYYITSNDLGDICNMLKNDPYSEFKAKRIVQMHNSFDGLLEACKLAIKSNEPYKELKSAITEAEKE